MEKEKQGFIDNAKDYLKKMFKVGLVAGGVMLAGMSQAEAANNQPIVDNGSQIKMADVMQKNMTEQATSLCVQRALLNEIASSQEYRTLAVQAMRSGDPTVKAQYATKVKVLQDKARMLESQILEITEKNPQIKVPGLSITRGENNEAKVNLKAKVMHAKNSRMGTVILGDGNSLDNSVRMYDYKTGKIYSDPVTMQKDLEKEGREFGAQQQTNSQTQIRNQGQER